MQPQAEGEVPLPDQATVRHHMDPCLHGLLPSAARYDHHRRVRFSGPSKGDVMISDYGVRVMINAARITNESDDFDPADFEGDDFQSASRRDLVRDQMMSDPRYDRRIEDVLKAMEDRKSVV